MGAQKLPRFTRGTHQKTLDMEHSATLSRLQSSMQELKDADRVIKDIDDRIASMEGRGKSSLNDCELEELLRLKDRRHAMHKDLGDRKAACDEVEYFLKTGGILFNYYEIIDKGSIVAPSKAVATAGAASTSASASATKNSIMKYFAADVAVVPATTSDEPEGVVKPAPEPHAIHASCGGGGVQFGGPRGAANDRATLLEKYLVHTDHNYIKVEPAEDADVQPCAHCGCADKTVMIHDGYTYCNGCFTVEYVLVDHEKPSYKEPPKEITYFSYKRINHFNEWLNQIQGKETTEIPEEVYDKILLEIKKQKINNMAALTNAKVRDILKKLKINKYYEHIPHIINRLSGISMPHITPELEERLRHMFCQIQVPFLKHSPASRKNFLSYSYVLHKFMQLLEKDHYLPCFPLLKSRDKLLAQDNIWRCICDELGWEFVRSL